MNPFQIKIPKKAQVEEIAYNPIDTPETQGNVDESGLPVVSIGDIPFADDDVQQSDEDNQDREKPEEQQNLNQENQIPDASTMSNEDAVKYSIENNLVMHISYLTLPKKKKWIGPTRGQITIYRNIEPNGTFTANETGNNLVVVWDKQMNGIRAYVIDRILSKEFTGEKFNKRFVVR